MSKVACRLPHGLVLTHPLDDKVTVTLKGLNAHHPIKVPYATTDVPNDFWEIWSATNPTFPALLNGSIFAAKNENEVLAVSREVATEETGLQPMKTDGTDKRAKGAKKKVED